MLILRIATTSDHALGACGLCGTLLSLAAFPLLIFKKERIKYAELESWVLCIFLGNNIWVAPSRNVLPHLCSLSQPISKSHLENSLSYVACPSQRRTVQTLGPHAALGWLRGPHLSFSCRK